MAQAGIHGGGYRKLHPLGYDQIKQPETPPLRRLLALAAGIDIPDWHGSV